MFISMKANTLIKEYLIINFITKRNKTKNKNKANSRFLLSEHILCKESIVIMKEIDFEILTNLYFFRFSDSIYAIFTMTCARLCVCTCD